MKRQSSKESMARLFQRYVWLVDLIYRHNHNITFKEINEKWQNSPLNDRREGFPLKTFHNHKAAISSMFDIDIECNSHAGYTYYIENWDGINSGDAKAWLVNTFAVNNMLNEHRRIKDRILFESIPSGQHFLIPILEAMQEDTGIEICYQSFTQSEEHTFEIYPYCVKLFNQRWYVVGYGSYCEEVRTYALDRIKEVTPTKHEFTIPEDFNADIYFKHSYGISNYGNAELIGIKVFHKYHKELYFKSLPLHPSQTEKEESKEYTLFEYYIQPTYDFKQELLSHGAEIEVVYPKELRDEIKKGLKEQLDLYR